MTRRILILMVFVSAGFAAGLVLTGRMRTADEATAAPPAAATPSSSIEQPARGVPAGLPDLTAVAERAIGSVTNISSTQIVRTPNSPFANDPFFRDFFGQDDLFGYRERRAQSLGSGVVVSNDGYVMTNAHVIGNSRAEVTVTLPDKRELRARIVGADEMTDIAVLKVSGGNLATIPWGDSSKLKVAEWVLAIGNPYQLNQSVTLGIVSATGRSVGLATYEDFIQTDAAINPGNSGGALINARGELVGINTAIFSESGGYQGIGFAVPSNLARHVMDDLIKYGSVRRGTIRGILLEGLTPPIAERLGAPNTRGMLVVRIDQRSDAYQAGLRGGDIIARFNGTAVQDEPHFIRLLSDAKIGSTAALGVLRDGREATVRVPIVQASGRARR
jgi:Do/DeqQ family serine protease